MEGHATYHPRPVIHISSDGTPQSTKVVGPDGVEIGGVTEVEILADVSETFVEIKLVIRNPTRIDLDGSVAVIVFRCPLCSEVLDEHQCHAP